MSKTGLENFVCADIRTDLSVDTLKKAMLDNLYFVQGKFQDIATVNDYYMAVAYTVRDRLLKKWIMSTEKFMSADVKTVAYLSAEYLLGPHLENNLVNLGISKEVEQACLENGVNLRELIEQEEEPGLGNGGLGRLAACYMDSLATLKIPAIGYGIRYEFGIFDQLIKDGWQVEITDRWLHFGNPWEIAKPEMTVEVKFGGHTEYVTDEKGNYSIKWVPHHVVNGVPYDTPIVGYHLANANTLRLWKAEAPESFDFQAFNVGDYFGSVQQKVSSENISKVLYPNDEQMQGKQLRLEQQYFFVSCSLQDLMRIHLHKHHRLDNFHDKVAIQLNDTHPSIAVAELMRLFVDVRKMPWEQAWDITCKTFGYTNHTLMPEALEQWPLPLFADLLPRHLEIIREINRRFLEQVAKKFPGDGARQQRMSIIDEFGEKRVRMAYLATVGSSHVNGVAALHTDLLKKDVLRDFYEMWPEKFLNVTNGVTPRRWLLVSNKELTELIASKIGYEWVRNMHELEGLKEFATDKVFQKQWREIKHAHKAALAAYIKKRRDLEIDPNSMFDIQVKRLHEYKRQHLNVLHIVTLFNRIKKNPKQAITPRTFIFGGKAAPGYYMAKLIIKLINSVADVVNNDADVNGRIKVVFLQDYNVTYGQRVYPAADLSEQISTAGKEASGTSNMKFSMNGALTVGTLDGANIEIREEVGADNFFLFGLTAQEVYDLKSAGYNPRHYYESNAALKEVLDQIGSGYFSNGNSELFRPLVDSLLNRDEFLVLADYQAYVDCQDQVAKAYLDQENWTRMSILNVASMGKFSSDRSIREYAQNIWQVEPVQVT